MNAAAKAGLVNGYYKVTNQIITTSLKASTVTATPAEKIVTLPGKEAHNNYSLYKRVPSGVLQASSGLSGMLSFVQQTLLLHY